MEKYIPLDKRSKKAQKEHNKKQRATWGMSPITRVGKDMSKYSRKRRKNEDRKRMREDV